MAIEIPKYSEQFFTQSELALSNDFLEKGYVILPADDRGALDEIRDCLVEASAKFLNIAPPADADRFLNEIGSKVNSETLNQYRMSLISQFNAQPWARAKYFALARRTLEVLIGNELVMQKRINLSIQLPQDASSLLPVHSDVWSGDSPYEMVLWVPLVDCYRTKSMFILPPRRNEEFVARFSELNNKSAEDLYKMIEPDLIWLEIPYGHVLLFTHILMHGNRVNREVDARWSMNCRFKSVFSPYWDKRVGDFFEPITVRPATRWGMQYKLPGGFHE